MLPKSLQNAPRSVTLSCCFERESENAKTCFFTAQARTDRGSGNPENHQKATKTRHANKRPQAPSIFMEKCQKGFQKRVVIQLLNLIFVGDAPVNIGVPVANEELSEFAAS